MSKETRAKVYTGLIIGYRRGSNTQYENQVLIRVDGVANSNQASRLIGWKVLYKDTRGNEYHGKIIDIHGNKGVVIARFNRNLPGQAIGKDIYIYPKGTELIFEEK